MKTIWTNDKTIERLARTAFPNWRGKRLKVSTLPESGELSVIGTAWSGGSRSSYVAIDLNSGRTMLAAAVNPLRDRDSRIAVIPPGFCVVEHSMFLGKDHGCTVYLHSANLAKLLPAAEAIDLTLDDRLVLASTCEYKNTYSGRTNIRFHEANRYHTISAAEWETAKLSLIGRGLLRKNGSISPDGRNAIGSVRLHNLKGADNE